jgi:mono/diheme cytochrome c family protein
MKRVNVVTGIIASAAILFVFGGTLRAATTAAPAGDPVKGEKVYASQTCKTCHQINGAGGKLAGDLSAIGAKRDAAWLAKYLVNPTVLDPKNPPKIKMTPTTAKGQDLDDLVAYLASLKGKK